MRAVFFAVLRPLSSIGLACVLLVLLALLTWLGTLEQVHFGLFEVQKKYFESFFLIHHAGSIPIPLPGANLVLCVLFVNILVGGIVRLRKGWGTAGILIAHLGIAFMLLSGFIKLYYSDDGHVTLFEDESADYFQSYYRWELVVTRETGDGRLQELRVPQEDFLDAVGSETVTLTSAELPFDLEVRHFMRNCRVMPKGPMFEVPVPVLEGVFLKEESILAQAEANVAGLYATVVGDGRREDGILWGRQLAPWTVEVGGSRYAIGFRKERYPMPFTIQLDKFTKEDHPRMEMPRSFSSDVTVTEGASSRAVEISMNEPLRDGGLVLYQASWGPSNARPGDPLFSTLSVVRNPADQYPLYSCIVISVGLVLHFSRKLTKYIRSENRRS
jgi:hypothetical protein